MTTTAQLNSMIAAHVQADARARFIQRTYAHLAGAIALFVLLEAILLKSPFADMMMEFVSASPMA